LPAADLPEEGTSVSVGMFDLAVDQPVWPSLTVGGFGYWSWFLPGTLAGGGARLTYRLGGSPGGAAWGVSLGAGYANVRVLSAAGYAWVQPALTATLPLGDTGFVLRGALGPSFYTAYTDAGSVFGLIPLPNMEVAFRLRPDLELAFGGYGLAAVRASF
jgi:hypothetical protein